MEKEDIKFVKWCIENDMHKFYTWTKWLSVRGEVLREDRYECQDCKKRKRITKATTVHHNQFVKKHPELALEVYYKYRGEQKRNLISLCHDCHEARHNYRAKERIYLTEEKW